MKLAKDIDDIKVFFDGYSNKFDSIYSSDLSKRNIFQKLIDKQFRKSMFGRYELTFRTIQNSDSKSILDIGCGSGIYANKLAKDGYIVTGIDVAPNMIKLAREYSEDINNPTYLVEDFLDMEDKKFDASILMGFFDYVSDVNLVFNKLKKTTNKMFMGSFPKDNGFLALQRKIRYKIRKCPLYLYNKNELDLLLKNHFNNFDILDNDREFFVIVRL